ncbi:envelope stress response membrane protein PspB [Azospirillum sp. INR13]|uniref:DNA-binding transcriptional regulator of psp operon n=1 Tax=Azospirillum lipoferum (strain 4B) TaxID=862719 RepID=G7Z863_AZOL4|nr:MULTISPECIES: envelope stress response membrane protein PspB [Azospirillum]KAA0573983.1 envelope stress response membrane protein PspB [Azospirillum sp. B21]MBF5094037.1 envelope stress response membrane protein PspB [Azospirillum sp. INR13]CBS85650.1 DNA-binding transcriptional regulator of psp operon [Azospirillum lipoferum 4B]
MGFLGFVLAVLFMVVVAPVWIVFHYITKWRAQRGLTAQDERLLAELWEISNRLETRVHALERVLDAEAPNWRNKV